MELAIFITVTEQILAHAAREHPHEACGLLLGRDRMIEAAVETVNVAADPECEFEIDPAALLRCHREAREGGLAVLGWYHSHPNGRSEPSAMDAARAIDDGKVWLILAAGEMRAFIARTATDGSRFEELELSFALRRTAVC